MSSEHEQRRIEATSVVGVGNQLDLAALSDDQGPSDPTLPAATSPLHGEDSLDTPAEMSTDLSTANLIRDLDCEISLTVPIGANSAGLAQRITKPRSIRCDRDVYTDPVIEFQVATGLIGLLPTPCAVVASSDPALTPESGRGSPGLNAGEIGIFDGTGRLLSKRSAQGSSERPSKAEQP